MMKGKRVLAILTSLALTVGALSVTTFATETAPQGASGTQAEVSPETPGEEQKQEEPAPQLTPEEICARDGHKYEVVQENPASCTDDGTIIKKCSVCGDETTEKGQKAHGHEYDQGVITREPTEDAEGVKTFTCIHCGDTKTESVPKLEKKEIPNLSIGFDQITKESGKIEAGKGTIKYEYNKKGKGRDETVTLTMDKATLKADSPKGQTPAPEAAISYTGEGKLVLSLKDENSVTGTFYTIYAPNATVEITGEEGAALTAEAAPENSNAIRAREIKIKDPMVITSPEAASIFTGDNGDNTTYQTIAVKSGSRNIAATSLTLQAPKEEAESEDQNQTDETVQQAGDQKEETPDGEQAGDQKEETPDGEQTGDQKEETPDGEQAGREGSDEKKDENADRQTFFTTEDGEDPDAEKDAVTEADADADKQDQDQDAQTADEPVNQAPARGKKSVPRLGAPANTTDEDGDKTEEPVLYIGGSPVEEGTIPAGEGTIEYKKNENGIELTLDKAVYEISSVTGGTDPEDAGRSVIYYTGEGTLSIILKGENSLTGKMSKYVIYAPKGTVAVSGTKEDSLKMEAAPEDSNTIRAKEISIEKPLVITEPENVQIASITGDDGNPYKNIADAENKAATSATIAAVKYTVTYEPGEGGSGTMDPETAYEGEKYKLQFSTFTAPENMEFDQWQVGDQKYDGGTEIDITENTTVTALWKDKEKPTHSHKMAKTAAKAATCTEDGNIEYYTCTECGKMYADVDGKTEISSKDKTVVTKTGHKWGNVTYTWAKDNSTVTAKRVCANDSSHTEEEKATASETTTATCVKDGKTTYTATFKNTAFEKQTKEVETKALGHSWGEPEFTWTDNSSKATAKFKCSRCGNEKAVTAKVTGMITVPTSKKDGKIDFTATATLDGKEYTDTDQKPVKAAGDKGYKFTVSPTAWARNGNKAMSFTVKRNLYDVITFSAFKSLTIDGKAVQNKNNASYTTEKGSLKLTFKPAYLKTLADGTHTLKINFADGSVETKFTVSATGAATGTATTGAKRTTATGSPRTGDTSNWGLWIGLIAISVIAIGAIVYVRKRNKK